MAPFPGSDRYCRLERVLHTQCEVVNILASIRFDLSITSIELGTLAEAVNTHNFPGIILGIKINIRNRTIGIITLAVCKIDQVVAKSGRATEEPDVGTITTTCSPE